MSKQNRQKTVWHKIDLASFIISNPTPVVEKEDRETGHVSVPTPPPQVAATPAPAVAKEAEKDVKTAIASTVSPLTSEPVAEKEEDEEEEEDYVKLCKKQCPFAYGLNRCKRWSSNWIECPYSHNICPVFKSNGNCPDGKQCKLIHWLSQRNAIHRARTLARQPKFDQTLAAALEVWESTRCKSDAVKKAKARFVDSDMDDSDSDYDFTLLPWQRDVREDERKNDHIHLEAMYRWKDNRVRVLVATSPTDKSEWNVYVGALRKMWPLSVFEEYKDEISDEHLKIIREVTRDKFGNYWKWVGNFYAQPDSLLHFFANSLQPLLHTILGDRYFGHWHVYGSRVFPRD